MTVRFSSDIMREREGERERGGGGRDRANRKSEKII